MPTETRRHIQPFMPFHRTEHRLQIGRAIIDTREARPQRRRTLIRKATIKTFG